MTYPLKSLSRSSGWQTIDLLTPFKRAQLQGGSSLFLDLWHPTLRGHEVAARGLAARLRDSGLVPSGR